MASVVSKCAEHNLLITNTIFRLADKYKTSWMHPRSKQWHLIDCIITLQRHRPMRGVEYRTDHRLIRAKFNIRIVPQHHKSPKLIRQAFSTARLLSAKYQQEFQSIIGDKFEAIGPLTDGPEESRNQFKEVVKETAQTVVGPKEKMKIRIGLTTMTRLYRPCWMRRERNTLNGRTTPTVPHCATDTGTVKPEPRESFTAGETNGGSRELKKCSSTTTQNHSKMLYITIKAIYGPSRSRTTTSPS